MHMSYKATVERKYTSCEKKETIHWEPAVSSKVLHERIDGTWLRRLPCVRIA